MSAIKNVMKNYYRNMELDEFLAKELVEAGYGGVDIQKTPMGTRITLYITRPGLVIGRKGMGIKDLTAKLETRFGLSNPQITVLEVEIPELNANIMANRAAHQMTRGTAHRRVAFWTLNTIMNGGALGAEVTISGKLRSERSHFDKYTMGIVPKSGDVAKRVVKEAIAHVLLKMGMYGIKIKIAYKAAIAPEFELVDNNMTIEEKENEDGEIEAQGSKKNE